MIELVDIDSVKPSAYNPREVDPKRLDIIELSLRKLGFLLPIYADKNGEILSGHQRHYVAKRMGMKRIPVVKIEEMVLDKRKAVNILFNRATNDFSRGDTSRTVTQKLMDADFISAADKIKSINPNSDEMFPCLRVEMVDIKPFLDKNRGRWNRYSKNLAVALMQKKIMMAVIAKKDFTIINGIGRLEMLAERKYNLVPVVYISDEQAEFAEIMLNKISMDFDIHTKYEDLLRYNSFRRAYTSRGGLGLGFFLAGFGKIRSKEFSFDKPETKRKWKAYYGVRVLDFGAGHLTDTEILKSINVDVTPFEPYKIKPGSNDIDKEMSIELSKNFLEKVESGYEWESIFISSVLNSVPFYDDRKHIVNLLAACSSERTKVYAWTMSIRAHQYNNFSMCALNQKFSKMIQFKLDYEPGIIIGDFSSKPKVQKFHTPIELKELFMNGFGDVKVKATMDSILAVSSKPKMNREALSKAIEFEFNLPYPDGTKMNLVKEAKKAFSKRLGVKL